MNIVGVVLAGGQSSRYGKPKMFELYKDRPFYEHSIQALKGAGINSVYVATNEQLSTQFIKRNVDIIIEEATHQGPLYALYNVMNSLQEDWFFILAADLPFVSTEFVSTLIGNINEDFDAIVPISGEQIQPLLAIYHRRCLPYLHELLNNNVKSLKPLLNDMHVYYPIFPGSQKDFRNINRPEDLHS